MSCGCSSTLVFLDRCLFSLHEILSANESIITQGHVFHTLPGVNYTDINFTANDTFKKYKTIIWFNGLNKIGFDDKLVRTAYI